MALVGCQWIDQSTLDDQLDGDNDGVQLDEDCDDADAAVGLAPLWWRDVDGDGFGAATTGEPLCGQPEGFVDNGEDCDDDAADVLPGGEEVCNGRDDDCDGDVDDADASLVAASASQWLPDQDGDGFPAAFDASVLVACAEPPGYAPSTDPEDCDDGESSVNPDGVELCNDAIDNDCDGLVDENGPNIGLWFVDDDGDGWPTNFQLVEQCDDENGLLVASAGFDPQVDPVDCEPDDPTIFPGNTETYYDAIDQNCDGLDDYDQDQDGYVPATFAAQSPLPSGDCDDLDPLVSPAAEEQCNGVDDDCDLETDEAPATGPGTVAVLLDLDLDGFPSSTLTTACSDGPGLVLQSANLETDCNDARVGVFPGAPEVPDDNIDQDCSGEDTRLCFGDADQDGVGGTLLVLVDGPDCGEATLVQGDCNDGDPEISPLATDWCDEIDQDCDGQPPVGTATLFFEDGSKQDLTPGSHALAGTESVAFCGGSWDVAFDAVPSTITEIRGLPGYTTILAPSGTLFDGGTDGWSVSFSGFTVEPAAETVFSATGSGELLLEDLFVTAGAPVALLDATGSEVALRGVHVDDVEATGAAPIIARASDVGLQQLSMINTSGAVSGGIWVENSTVTLADSRFIGSTGVEGGVLYGMGSDIEIRTVSMESPSASVIGGAIFVLGSELGLSDTSISDASAPLGGAIGGSLSGLILEGGSISDSLATSGGGMHLETSSLLCDGTFWSDNLADDGGGLLVAGSGLAVLLDASFSNNEATNDGGAMFCKDTTTCVVQGGFLFSNRAAVGGAIATSAGASLRVNLAVFESNEGTQGGAIAHESFSTPNINESAFRTNTADVGGALYATQPIEVQSSTFEANAAREGGAIYAVIRGLTVTATTFEENTAVEEGGAVKGKAMEVRGTFIGNSAMDGGAVFGLDFCGFGGSADSSVVTGDFTDNIALGAGGAFSQATWAGAGEACPSRHPSNVVVGGTFEGNQSELGGAIAARQPGVGMGAFSLFTGNQADLGGAVYGQLGPIPGGFLCPAAPSVFDGNNAVLGGAMYLLANSNVDCQGFLTNNTATSAAAVFLENGSLEDVSYATGNLADDGTEVRLGPGGSIQRTLFNGQSLVVGVPGQTCSFVGPTTIDCNGTSGCLVCP